MGWKPMCTMGSRSTGTINNFGRWKDELFAVGNIFVDNDMSKYRFIKWTGGNYTDTCNQNLTTSIKNENVNNVTIAIYPNPANDKIFVECTEPFSTGVCIITDLSGRIIKRTQFNRGQKEVLISEMAEGLYILKLSLDDKGTVYSKFVISR